jgi:hypothetical protein
MELFRAEKIADVPSTSVKKCFRCSEELEHVAAIVVSDTGRVIQIFKCNCGERAWDD